MYKALSFLIFLSCLSAACGNGGSQPATRVSSVADTPDTLAALAPAAVSAPLENGGYVNAAFVTAADGNTYIVGAAGVGGLTLHGSDGATAGNYLGIEAGMVVSVPASTTREPVLIAYDALASQLRGYALDGAGASLRDVMPQPVSVPDEVVGLCHHRSALSSTDFVYAVTDAGMIHHYELFDSDAGLNARLLRSVPSSKGSGFCVVDPRDASLYVAEEITGVWRFDAEPETDTERQPVDLREPFGNLSDDIKGIALYPVNEDTAYLLVVDVGFERVSVYRLPDGEVAGHFAVEGLGEPEGMTLGSAGNGETSLLVIADESEDAGGSDMKFVDWSTIGAELGLETSAALPERSAPVVVRASIETDIVPTYGDSADDPAIWVNPDNAAESLVIGTGKKSGLYVYDLEGRQLQEVADGRMNNVDLRDGFVLNGATMPIVTASNRSDDSIAVYRLDAAAKRLVDIADGRLDTGFTDPYGLCMYRSAASGNYYVFVNEGGTGLTRQWRLSDTGTGRVGIELVREIEVGSQAEGCVADDETATLYIAEEGIGLWKYSAEPDGGDARTEIDATNESGRPGRLTADAEGVALYAREDGTGFLVVSNQGADNYAVYRREGDNEYVGMFHVVANAAAGIDGASETDGLDVSSANLGGRFADGLLVVQDGRNIAPEERQNFKYVAWSDVAAALEIDD